MAKPQPDVREELRILATQIETINQQLAGSSGGSGPDPAVRTQLTQIEKKLDFLYSFSKGLQDTVMASVKDSLQQTNASMQKNMADNFVRVHEKLDSLAHGSDSSGVSELRNSLKSLLEVYKDEVEVFKEQNAFLQQQLERIDKRLG